MNSSIVQKKGYTWVVLPKEGILPLTLLEESSVGLFKRLRNLLPGAQHNLEVYSESLFDLFPKPAQGKIPKVSKAKAIAFFKGKDVVETGGGFELKGLQHFKALNAGAEANIKKARKLLYDFTDPKLYDISNRVLLEEHLNLCKPETKAPGILRKLKSGKLFVVTDVLQTQNFLIRDASDFELSGDISADAIEGYLAKAGADVHRDKDKSNTVAYEGEKPVTFAIKASRILYNEEDDSYTLRREKSATVRGVAEGLNTDSKDIFWMEIED
ncbi:MAG: hypothetical protein R3D00_04875 [Bacteroidia bacterium]